MEGLRQYAVSVVAAALACGILAGLIQEGTGRELLRLLSGILLAFTVLRPLVHADLDRLDILSLLDTQEAAAIADSGVAAAQNSMADIIKQRTEAYIVDKATALHADVTAAVTLSGGDPPVPAAVKLTGSASPQARRQLEAYIQTELGITRENLEWTG